MRRSRRRVAGGLTSYVDRHFAVLICLPALILVALVTLVPIAAGIGISLTDFSLMTPERWQFTGAENYRDLLSDPELPQVLVTTVTLVVGTVVAETITGLVLALLLVRTFRGVRVFRILYTMPLMIAGIAVAISWRYLYSVDFGWINYFLGVLHLPQPLWLAGAKTALPSIILADMWVGTPFMAILILAGLLNVPTDPIEAAKVDGANSFQVFRYVTLPAIQPVLVVAILFRTVGAFQKFELIQVMSSGGPGIATTTLNYYIWQTGFEFGQLGYAASLSVLLLLIMAITLVSTFMVGRIATGRSE